MDKAIRQYLSGIGSKGGRAVTPAKRKASANNGKLGGRSRKDHKENEQPLKGVNRF
jgi:hypothetical protein